MEWMRKMKHAIQRTADRATGRHVPVEPDPEAFDPRGARTPAVDILEGDDEVLLHVDMPGVSATRARTSYDRARRALVVSGEADDGSLYARSFELPDHLAPDDARATMSRGVLTVHVPKRALEETRAIPIKRLAA